MPNAAPPIPLASNNTARHLVWALIGVLLVALLFRVWNLSTWSLWEDEEGSISLAQKPFVGFQGFFPVFFVALNPILRATDMSIVAARAFPAIMGLVSILLTYTCFRRFVTPQAALIGALLLAVNIGHVFWSQSIRYYTTALVFQLLTLYWLFDGLERDRLLSLVLSNLVFVLALLTHFSALLLAPAMIAYVLYAAVFAERRAGYRLRNYLVFGLTLAVILAGFAWRVTQMRNMIGGWTIPSARDPVHIGATVVAYFGAPVLVLGLLAPWLSKELPRRTLVFLLCFSLIPVLELLVIGWLNIVNVTWYYAFVSLCGFALLSGVALFGLWHQGKRRFAGFLATGSMAYYLVFLCGYHLAWNGDRPRWDEAARFVSETVHDHEGVTSFPQIYASVPGVVAFYLGADPRRPESYQIVKQLPTQPLEAPSEDAWYVVEAKVVSSEFREWFAEHCKLRARFESLTGPIDRSVLVYQCTPTVVRAGKTVSRDFSNRSVP